MEIKKLWKYFVFTFLLILVLFNWNEVSWVFNYKAISGIISETFQKTSGLAFKSSEENISQYSDKENGLEIPKIEIFAPLIFVESSDINDVLKALDRGAVHFPTSVLPGETGQTVILGHSAPPGWPKIKYQGIFSEINELEEGDEIIVYFNHQKFSYFVTRKIFLEKGEEIPEDLTNSDNMLVLVSCWPPGKDIRRIAVMAE